MRAALKNEKLLSIGGETLFLPQTLKKQLEYIDQRYSLIRINMDESDIKDKGIKDG